MTLQELESIKDLGIILDNTQSPLEVISTKSSPRLVEWWDVLQEWVEISVKPQLLGTYT